MLRKQPKTLTKHDNAFKIQWKDGHTSRYPYPYLRQWCPCADCDITRHGGKDVHSLFSPQGDGDATLIEVSPDILPVDIQLVGRYALRFCWNDGHGTGIYPFEQLREMCPCNDCTPTEQQAAAQAHLQQITADKTEENMQTRQSSYDISPRELKKKIEQKQAFLLLDVREQNEYEIAHIDGALLIPLNELPQKLGSLDKTQEIVVYCHHGIRSQYATDYLRQNGFHTAKNLQGGIEQWTLEIH